MKINPVNEWNKIKQELIKIKKIHGEKITYQKWKQRYNVPRRKGYYENWPVQKFFSFKCILENNQLCDIKWSRISFLLYQSPYHSMMMNKSFILSKSHFTFFWNQFSYVKFCYIF